VNDNDVHLGNMAIYFLGLCNSFCLEDLVIFFILLLANILYPGLTTFASGDVIDHLERSMYDLEKLRRLVYKQ